MRPGRREGSIPNTYRVPTYLARAVPFMGPSRAELRALPGKGPCQSNISHPSAMHGSCAKGLPKMAGCGKASLYPDFNSATE